MHKYILLDENFIVNQHNISSVEYAEEFIESVGFIKYDSVESPIGRYFVDGELGPEAPEGYYWKYDSENNTHYVETLATIEEQQAELQAAQVLADSEAEAINSDAI